MQTDRKTHCDQHNNKHKNKTETPAGAEVQQSRGCSLDADMILPEVEGEKEEATGVKRVGEKRGISGQLAEERGW